MKDRSLRDLFHQVKHILPEEQHLITFSPDKLVKDALETMISHNYSHIPVVAGSEVLGVFSFRSFSKGLLRLPEKVRDDPLSLPVEEFLEKLNFAHITDELTTLLDEFNSTDAMLVGTESQLQGIVNTIDALQYFYHVASPFVLLQEIELAIRELIRASVSEDELRDCIVISLKKHYEESKRGLPNCLEGMTFHDYVQLLRFNGTWPKFQQAFGGSSLTTYAKLKPLPELRNDIFHFRREISLAEYDLLKEQRDWLQTRIRKIEASRRINKND